MIILRDLFRRLFAFFTPPFASLNSAKFELFLLENSFDKIFSLMPETSFVLPVSRAKWSSMLNFDSKLAEENVAPIEKRKQSVRTVSMLENPSIPF